MLAKKWQKNDRGKQVEVRRLKAEGKTKRYGANIQL
jgi:hypothetical protein